jgi:hypothetical protein
MTAFSISCFALAAMDGKIKQCACTRFCVKLGKSNIENLEMLLEAFGEHSSNHRLVIE